MIDLLAQAGGFELGGPAPVADPADLIALENVAIIVCGLVIALCLAFAVSTWWAVSPRRSLRRSLGRERVIRKVEGGKG